MVENAGKGGGKWVGKMGGKCIAFELGFCVSVFRLGFSPVAINSQIGHRHFWGVVAPSFGFNCSEN